MRLTPILIAAAVVLVVLAVVIIRACVRTEAPALLVPPALGRTDRVWVFGRVLHEAYGEHGPRPVRTARGLAGRNLTGVAVEVSFLGQTEKAVCGHDGEFEVELVAPADRPFLPGRHKAEVKVGGVTVEATVEVIAPGAPYLLVSDFDDTVAVTNVGSIRKLLTSTFLEDGDTQPAVPGMAALYRCLTAGGAPLVFVSGSPVQLAPRLTRFLEKNGFPPAALHLRNLGTDTLSHYKEPVLERLSERFPELPFVVVGDSGERDPEIYAAFMRAHPGRVLRAYLRKATDDPGPAPRFEGELLFRDPAEVAADAKEKLAVDTCTGAAP
jgi:phosphatidate phosphatase APP1